LRDVAGDVGGFVAGQKYDGGGYLASRNPCGPSGMRVPQFLSYFVRKHGSHRSFDEAGSYRIHGNVAGGDFDGDGFGLGQ